jgi:hypothetical protein
MDGGCEKETRMNDFADFDTALTRPGKEFCRETAESARQAISALTSHRLEAKLFTKGGFIIPATKHFNSVTPAKAGIH